jgi:hypothetical protein
MTLLNQLNQLQKRILPKIMLKTLVLLLTTLLKLVVCEIPNDQRQS